MNRDGDTWRLASLIFAKFHQVQQPHERFVPLDEMQSDVQHWYYDLARAIEKDLPELGWQKID